MELSLAVVAAAAASWRYSLESVTWLNACMCVWGKEEEEKDLSIPRMYVYGQLRVYDYNARSTGQSHSAATSDILMMLVGSRQFHIRE